MNSLQMAIDAIYFLKNTKGCFLHCTEFGYDWRADAIGYNGKYMFEVEVKTSWSDFRADFANKKKKHQMLLDSYFERCRKKCYNYIPNYMYYLVTPNIQKEALKYMLDSELPYGLMVHTPPKNGRFGEMESIKKVKRIHGDAIPQQELNIMMARMSNEYFYGFLDLKRNLKERIDGAIIDTFRGFTERAVIDTNESISKIFVSDNK